jgi:dTDP-4-dehydrorhamnose 3,5-epimerase
MEVATAALPGMLIIQPTVHRDHRGFFLETYQERRYRAAGIAERFVQDNHSRSLRGTLRGLHAQVRNPQGKLVRAVEGEIFDVAVDLRLDSPTLGQWAGVHLRDAEFTQCYIPAGLAHGFCVLSEAAQVEYKCTAFYDPDSELSLLWNDTEVGIQWPVAEPTLSEKDRNGLPLRALLERLRASAHASR